MKGQLWTYGGILIVLILSSLALITVSATGEVNRSIVTIEGKMVSFVNYAHLITKTFNQSIEFISQRAAYDLGKKGGIDGSEIAVWNISYPSLDILRKQLEIKIKENLPQGTIEGNERSISFGNCDLKIKNILLGDVNFDDIINEIDFNICSAAYGSTPSSPNWNFNCDFDNNKEIDLFDMLYIGVNFGKSIEDFGYSHSFNIEGFKEISIYDKSIDSRIDINQIINHTIGSSYFKLLYVGRQIVENETFSSQLNNISNLKKLLSSIFPDLEFEINLVSKSIEVTIADKSCLPNGFYCLAPLRPGEIGIVDPLTGKQVPYDYLKLKFKVDISKLTACNDGIDNDGDGLIDSEDPGCHSDWDQYNPLTYVPGNNDENNCGNNICDGSESIIHNNCPVDCYCNKDGFCDKIHGERCDNCNDCKCPSGFKCCPDGFCYSLLCPL